MAELACLRPPKIPHRKTRGSLRWAGLTRIDRLLTETVLKVTGTHIENPAGVPVASREAVKAFQYWCLLLGVEMDEAAAAASRVHGKCAADFEVESAPPAGAREA